MDKDRIIKALELSLKMALHEIYNGTQKEVDYPCVNPDDVAENCKLALESLGQM